MSCTDDEAVVERTIELEASPERVWDEIPFLLEDEERVLVVDEALPSERLSFWWAARNGDGVPSYVEIELEASGVGTLLRVRETRLDGGGLLRSVLSGFAVARS